MNLNLKMMALSHGNLQRFLHLQKQKKPLHLDKIVIGADTIVDCDGKIIGKPENANHAKQIVEELFSKAHKVITGIAIIRINDNTEIVTHDVTIVYPKKMSPGQIAEHIKTGTWQDKAGAYAIQENGDEFVEKIEGSLTNVMGFPMELIEKELSKLLETK